MSGYRLGLEGAILIYSILIAKRIAQAFGISRTAFVAACLALDVAKAEAIRA